MSSVLRRTFLTSALCGILAAGCSVQESTPAKTRGSPTPSVNKGPETPDEPAVKLSGEVLADGSSTVFPITQAVAEEFMKVHQDVKVSVGIAGTGGGFKRFVVGETDINDASRPISEKEVEACKKSGVEYHTRCEQ